MTTQTSTSTPTIALREVDIYVFDTKKKAWKHRTTVAITPTGDDNSDANKALKDKREGYGISGSRPRLGEATSKSGKRFKAVPTIAG